MFALTSAQLRLIDSNFYKTRPIYWSVTDYSNNTTTRFDTRVAAFLFKEKLAHAAMHYHWYEDEMARLRLDVEPESTLPELYRARAYELRDMYSYIRLYYSGGADSHTALLSFVKNNIYIDEIVVTVNIDSSFSDTMLTTSRELTLAALPYLKSIEHLIPNTKVTILRPSVDDYSQWLTPDVSSLTDIQEYDSTDGGAGQFWLGSSWALRKVLASSDIKNSCDLFGGTKARVFVNNVGRWYTYFLDSATHAGHASQTMEDFFVSRHIPTLFLKTAYSLQRYHNAKGTPVDQINKFSSGYGNITNYNIALGREPTPAITQLKMANMYYSHEHWEKQRVAGYTNKLLYDNVINTTEGKLWHKNYSLINEMLISALPNYWRVDRVGNPVPALGLSGLLSKFYCLTDGKTYSSTDANFS